MNLGRPSIARKLALAIAGLNLVLALVGLTLLIAFGASLTVALIVVNAAVYSVIAVLILSREPRHVVGWLLLVVGFIFALLILSGGSSEAFIIGDNPAFLVTVLAWISGVLFLPPFMIALTLVLQFFPDGRLPSRRWWPVPALSVFAIVGFAASVAILPGPMSEEGIGPDNPFGIPGSEPFLSSLNIVLQAAFAIGVIGAIVILIVRFRRADPIQRTQMKWLFFTAIIGISLLLVPPNFSSILGVDLAAIETQIFVLLPSLLAAAIGIAILRYRLFDIDIIIRRTIQYAIITAVLALIYFGLVVLFQTLFAAVGGIQSNNFLIVLSTLLIAALFNPVRNRVQGAVDRRFYRQKYHAERVLSQFATTARDEVDLDRLSAVLLDIVQETMQPESVSLSLFKRERG